ncbi:hypothetical protein BGZ94_008731 [Podila epigama]|nr:hypothetical protein BGZ94_008731 [Podila epigama]
MALIRTPVATRMHYGRQISTTPRCLVVSLTFAFILLNWLMYHVFQGRILYTSEESTDDTTFDTQQQSPLSLLKQPHYQPWIVDRNRTSHREGPNWLGNWLRWRGLDPGHAEARVTENQKGFDVIYTWVNGSDVDLQQLRLELQAQSPLFNLPAAGDKKKIEAVTSKRFRDMDELRFSVRSVSQNAANTIRQIYLLTTESRPGIAQRPVWLKDTSAMLPEGGLRVVPHREIFSNDADLPTFNSLAIESQMHNLPGLSDIFLYMNDDVFVGTKMLPSDIWTSLYGFVFHLESSLLVPPTIRPVESNPVNVGEWNSLQYSNYLLSKRFGPRYRAYLAHIAHVLSVPIIEEIREQWPYDFNSTRSHRFRGEGEARDIHISFFMAHYVMEMLRETQLASYWQFRLDANQDGQLDYNERQTLVDMVRIWNENQLLPRDSPQRKSHSRLARIDGHEAVLAKVGIEMSGSTQYRQSGLDGYPYMIPTADTSKSIPLAKYKDEKGTERGPQKPYTQYEQPRARGCRLDMNFCFGPEFMNTNPNSTLTTAQSRKIFDRLAKDEFHCGDCLLELLLQHPSIQGGIGAILPIDETSDAFQQVTEKLGRYNYVLGTSPYWFIALQGHESATKNLNGLLAQRASIAYFCINDDFSDDPVFETQMQRLFRDFLEKRFSEPSPWEIPGSLPKIPEIHAAT